MTAAAPQPTPGILLERAYAHHAAACALYARQITGAAADAEDATQEAFVRLMAHLQRQGRMPEVPRAWLLTATRSAAIDRVRSEARRRRREAATPRQELFVVRQDERLDAQAVAAALSRLPQRQREVVTLRIWGELGFAEIAELLGVAISTAHGDYAAGLAGLRHAMDAMPPAPADHRQRSTL